VWVRDCGFADFGDNYSMAVQIILVFLSCCIANPVYRRYLSIQITTMVSRR